MNVNIITDNYSLMGDTDDLVYLTCPYNPDVIKTMHEFGGTMDKETKVWGVSGSVTTNLQARLEAIWPSGGRKSVCYLMYEPGDCGQVEKDIRYRAGKLLGDEYNAGMSLDDIESAMWRKRQTLLGGNKQTLRSVDSVIKNVGLLKVRLRNYSVYVNSGLVDNEKIEAIHSMRSVATGLYNELMDLYDTFVTDGVYNHLAVKDIDLITSVLTTALEKVKETMALRV